MAKHNKILITLKFDKLKKLCKRFCMKDKKDIILKKRDIKTTE